MFQFALTEPLHHEVRRLALGELKSADAALADAEDALATRVHEARKRLKRLRALLSLLEGAEPADAIRAVAVNARAAAHDLAIPRENAALLQCFDDLVRNNPDGASRALRGEFAARVQRTTLGAESYLEQARENIRQARKAAKELELVAEGFAAIADGFRATYRSARQALRTARKHGGAPNFHAFRKPSKRHLYQLRLLEPAFPSLLQAQAVEVDELGERLGEHHDLCLLALELDKVPPSDSERALSRAISQRVQELESEVLARGARCFAERPSAITRRVGRYYTLAAR